MSLKFASNVICMNFFIAQMIVTFIRKFGTLNVMMLQMCAHLFLNVLFNFCPTGKVFKLWSIVCDKHEYHSKKKR
jgi:hypothetical protein